MTSPPDKAALRRGALARRDELTPEVRNRLGGALSARILSLEPDWPEGPVSAFWPIRSEYDPRPLMADLAARGRALALPRVEKPVLSFRRYAVGDALVSGGFGLSEPGPGVPLLRPRVMLVPLAAFDRRCHRIGYGAGFYDRAIADFSASGEPPLTIGVAFSVQEVDAVPDEWHDRVLDAIVTERETIRPIRA
jgi:5-formyltetrahydrofolate cyclo-ligase